MKIRNLLLSTATVIALGLSAPAQAASNLLLIVDSSNSMWGQVDGKSKMESARETLNKLVSDLPSDTKLALMAYGHRRDKDCQDVEVLSGIGKNPTDILQKLISSLQPTGKTPISFALESSKAVFKGHEGENNNILLVSDGIESCDGDPCATAKSLKDSGVAVRAHVVGFGLTKEEGKQLTCIADNSGGKYFDASNVESFNKAVAEVTQLASAAAAPPAPKPEPVVEKQPTVYFEDNFDAADLSADWTVSNPNPEQFIVEAGKLLLIGKSVGTLGTKADMANILKLGKPLPAGDWTATIELRAELQTGRDQFSFGVYDDQQNHIVGNFFAQKDVCCYSSNMFLQILKVAGGETTKFDHTMFKAGSSDFGKFVATVPGNGKMTFKFIKKDRTFRAMAHIDGNKDEKGNDVWTETETVTSLRAPKQFAFNASQFNNTDGETQYQIDSIKIEELK